MTFILLLTSALFTVQASAAETEIAKLCPDLNALHRAVNKCQLNPFFVKASNNCLAKLDSEIKLQTAALTGAMNAANAASASAQAGKLVNHGQNLASSKASLESLRGAARQVRDKLVGYRENMVRAGDVSMEFSKKLGKTFNSILEGFPCYRDSHAAITKYVTAAEKKIAELDQAIGGTGALAGRTDSSTKLVGTSSAGPGKVSTGKAAAPEVRAPAERKGPSTITGDTKKAELPQ